MREPAFLRQNKDKWLEYERSLFGTESTENDPDRLAKLYIQLTDDLAYARTFYPKSKTVKYLNGLAARTHLAIYKNRKEKRNRLLTFWKEELPLVIRESHKYMFYSLVVFLVSAAIGLVSTYHDNTFVNVILGDAYVNMTIKNIDQGTPTAIYASSEELPMFLAIAFNNIRVSFYAFVMGIFFSVGTVYIIFNNGVMVGAFFGFFMIRSLSMQALPVIMLHGTLELSAIVIAGGAGMVMGNSILFPGTFSRAKSFQEGAAKGIKIVFGLIPVFLMAAFIEGYVTRYADMPNPLKFVIIGASAAFILWYYVFYPISVKQNIEREMQLI